MAIAIVIAAVVSAGCAGGDSPGVVSAGGAGSGDHLPATADRAEQIERYRSCLQDHGVVLLDNPTGEGLPQIDKNRTTIEQASEATENCRRFTPTGGDVAERPDPADIAARQQYAACVREHGVPEFPDPDPLTGDTRLGDLAGRLKDDPRMTAAMRDCQGILARPDQTGVVGG